MSLNAHDQSSEMALLGAMITAPATALTAFMTVAPEAYWSPKHQEIASVLRDMVARRTPIDAITVLATVEDLGILGKIGGGPYLHTLIAACPTATNADFYAQWLCELYGRRMLAESLTREVQRLDALWEAGERTAAADSVLRIRAACEDVTTYTSCGPMEHITYLDEFLDRDMPHNWLVPGLLERGDRLILTGEEGLGKTELATQVACALAGGIHPFTSAPLRDGGLRVAIVDCENGQGQTQRRVRRIVGAVQNQRVLRQAGYLDWSKHLAIEFRTDGLDLFNGTDVAWLERYVAATTPDLLLVGPLYKMHTADENDSQAARVITSVLDGIRARHGCAVITEAHAGHSKDANGARYMRPRGSALFLGWPEFGLGLRKVKDDDSGNAADLVEWRGNREERNWPKMMYRAASETSLPWIPNEEYRDYDMEG
jgi:replicative DNA helicase